MIKIAICISVKLYDRISLTWLYFQLFAGACNELQNGYRKTTWKGTTFGIVHMAGVAKNHRRKGLGRAVVLIALQRLKELHLVPVIIGTMEERIFAICLYLSLGFTPLCT